MRIAVQEHEGFRAIADRETDHIAAALSGNADDRAAILLEVVFKTIHLAAVASGMSVVLDLRDLEFLNSAGLKRILTWISEIQALAPSQRYRICFVSNPEIHWQVRSLHAVRCFASDLITISHA